MIKKVSFICILFILAIFLLESASFLVLMCNSIFRQKLGLSFALGDRFQELRIAWSQKVFYGGYDPLVQTQLMPFSKYSKDLMVNEHGFIGNSNTDETLNIFPEKPEGVIRIIALGGSSLAGCGYTTNDTTIPALLEKSLNSHYVKSKKRYQVLNFGMPGGCTGLEISKFFLQLVYFQPDIIICFDGFNDAWYAAFEPERVGIEHAIANWADFSYKYFEFMNGYGRREEYPVKVLTFTSSLALKAKKFLKIKKNVLPLYSGYPFYKQSVFIGANDPGFNIVTYNNLDFLASYIAMNPDIELFCYLQPHTLNGKKVLSKTEKANIDDWFIKNAFYGSEKLKQKTYTRKMKEIFDGLEMVYKKLGFKYKDFSNIRFYSITDIFSDTKETVFLDQVHLVYRGNTMIAERIMKDMINSDKD